MRRIGYRRTADVTGACVSREHMRRSLHQAARGTPPRTAYVARSSAPSICVTSGPGVPTGGSLSHAQRLRAPSSADERFDSLYTRYTCAVECDFVRQYPKPAGPKSRRFLAGCNFLRVHAKTRRNRENEIGDAEGMWGMRCERALLRSTSPDAQARRLLLRQPGVDDLFQHVERHRPLVEDHVVEFADVELIAELLLGARPEFENF